MAKHAVALNFPGEFGEEIASSLTNRFSQNRGADPR
ncbi:hypothetical protein J2R76_002510 [Bradyrhizobium sp. USDA 4532]|nr:hypothetical protein [Bradyrhizobium sp. USDA 4545]MCP1918919.1 hypothetical protein [Bradyrhizobium sp. USDA 4532]